MKFLTKFWIFDTFFDFYGYIWTLLLQKTVLGRTRSVKYAKIHDFRNQKSGFFKVWDTLTMIQPRKKKHLTNVSSPLKTFFDHLQGRWENMIFLIFFEFPFFTNFCSFTLVMCAKSEISEKSIFFNFLSDLASGQKTFLGAN